MVGDSRLVSLLDEADSEAKRLGSSQCIDLHVALVLVKRSTVAAEKLGVNESQLERTLRSGTTSGGRTAQELLDAASDMADDTLSVSDAVIDLLRARVGELERSSSLELGASAEPSLDRLQDDTAAIEERRPVAADPVQSVVQSETPLDSQTCQVVLAPGRERLIDQLVTFLALRHSTQIVVHGRPGVGRTSLVRELTDRLAASRPDRIVRYIPAAEFLTDPAAAGALARSASAGQVFIIDDIDLVLGLEQQYSNPQLIASVSALLAARSASIVVVISTALRGRFEMMMGRLAIECRVVEVPPLVDGDLAHVLTLAAIDLVAHHDVCFVEGAFAAAAGPAAPGEHRAQPALGIRRLDEAAATAAANHRTHVGADDVLVGCSPAGIVMGDDLSERLSAAVLGQDHAVERLSQRLLLTRSGLDLRPERPDGVFLFVGPSGVGKTALARSLALELFGSESKLIRLDMSEYAEPWAISRLIGPQPGYVGSTEPDSWLTTKVRNQPDSVVLLDEIEKAHPDVWNVFLQVFDAGRLTDSKGEVADFSSCVVIMTSNLGTGVSERKAVGFAQSTDDPLEAENRVLDVVKNSMRPELLNRLDGTIVFRSLDTEAIRRIAEVEIRRVVGILAARGFVVHPDENVADFISNDGYDPTYGARHVQRSIERNLLEPLVARGRGRWQVSVIDGDLAWHEQGQAG